MASNNNEFYPNNWNCQEFGGVSTAFNNIVEVIDNVIAVIDNENGLTEISVVPMPSNAVEIQSVDILSPGNIKHEEQQVVMPQNVNQNVGQQTFMGVNNNDLIWGNYNNAQLLGNVAVNPSEPANPLEITNFFHNISKQLVERGISVDDFNIIKNKLADIFPDSLETKKEEKTSIIRLRVTND